MIGNQYHEKVDQDINESDPLICLFDLSLYFIEGHRAEAVSPSTPVRISESEDVKLAVDDPLNTYSSLLRGRTTLLGAPNHRAGFCSEVIVMKSCWWERTVKFTPNLKGPAAR